MQHRNRDKSMNKEDYEKSLYDERIPNDVRCLVYDYLEPIHLSFVIRNAENRYGNIIKSESTKKYIEKRMRRDFIVDNIGNSVPKPQNTEPKSDKLTSIYRNFTQKDYDTFLLYHYFSVFISKCYKGYTKYTPGTFNNTLINMYFMPLFNYDIVRKPTMINRKQKIIAKLLYRKPLYNRDEILKLLSVIADADYMYMRTPYGALDELEPFERYDVLPEFFGMVVRTKFSNIPLIVGCLTNFEVENNDAFQELEKRIQNCNKRRNKAKF